MVIHLIERAAIDPSDEYDEPLFTGSIWGARHGERVLITAATGRQ
ncbi:hypothetical protein C486_03244 [Natrinema gari JCM 14663]|uniref:Uncharacterized protein n=1 Tax=Natrinema gari JCM 14663 TaxID=1230459 RepID=L9ZCH3_9EURY|nr:hypothetical protein C486_03244 [Natrinema gari JCM 14663]